MRTLYTVLLSILTFALGMGAVMLFQHFRGPTNCCECQAKGGVCKMTVDGSKSTYTGCNMN